jgi:hypothetical protein
MHKSHEETFGRKPDFRVTYKIYSQEEGGRHGWTLQGIRWDFLYEHPEHKKGELFIIHPEFEDSNGKLITDSQLPIPRYGMARMWIINDKFIDYHRGKIKIGTHGYFMEGNRKVGECDVIELINLK